jgi:fructose-bisphosphate aldolase class II
MTSSKTNIAPGVITGDEVQQLFAYAKANAFALSAINVTGSNTINAKGEN